MTKISSVWYKIRSLEYPVRMNLISFQLQWDGFQIVVYDSNQELILISMMNFCPKRSWSVMAPIYTGITLRDTKTDFVLSIIQEHQRSQVNQWVDLKSNLLATRYRFVLHSMWTVALRIWDNQMTRRYINVSSKKEKTGSLSS